MILVFFMCFFTIVALLIIVLVLSTIRINVEKLKITNINPDNKTNYDFNTKLQLYFLNKIRILNINITEKTLKNIRIKEKIKQINMKQIEAKVINKEIIKNVKNLKINLSKLNLEMKIGTEDVILTSALVAIISSILGLIIARIINQYKESKYKYTIQPEYKGENLIKINLNCIIEIKIVHIIYVIYILLKGKRVDKNERTSNRRSYGYSYE